jgi:hypothetical protein
MLPRGFDAHDADEAAAAAAARQQEPSGACYHGEGAPGMSALQRHSLMCWAERLLGPAGPAGRQAPRSLFRSGGELGDAAQRELAAFHASLLRWPALLDFPAAVTQVHQAPCAGSMPTHATCNMFQFHFTQHCILHMALHEPV